MGQQQTIPKTSQQTQRSYQIPKNEQFYNKRIEHQGLLKLRPVPFKNCIEIQTQNTSLFLQNIEITLKDLLQSRLYTNKLFPKEDIERLIENVTYTLAYLSQNQVPYKDLGPQNVFYDDGVFKLLPNELIPESRYEKFLSGRTRKSCEQQQEQEQQQFVALSPQMIIAYRCRQSAISDLDIINKSNVFYLGMMLLQTTTLLPAHECYDIESCDILDEVITQRVQLVKEYYSQEIASIIANMLDYDYQQRMSLKQMSIFINRQLNKDLIINSKITKDLSNKKQPKVIARTQNQPGDFVSEDNHCIVTHSQYKNQNVSVCKSRIETSQETESRVSRPSQIGSISQKKRNKTNKVYINGGMHQQQPEEQQSTFNRQDRNKVYMKQNQSYEQQAKRYYQNETSPYQNQRLATPLRQISSTSNTVLQQGLQKSQTTGKLLNMSQTRQKLTPSVPQYKPRTKNYQVNNEEEQQNRCPPSQEYVQQRSMKRKNSTDYLGYRVSNAVAIKTPNNQKYLQQQRRFQYGQSFEDRTSVNNNYIYHNSSKQEDSGYPQQRKQGSFGLRYADRQSPLNQDSGSRGYFEASKPILKNSQVNGNADFKEHNNSLSRIKSQIERSRKLIQEFKRGQNCQF